MRMLVGFSCKRCGFCPSCGARRMAETAAHLVEHVLPEQPIRQWVLSFPLPATVSVRDPPRGALPSLGIVYRAISTFLIRRAGLRVGAGARTGAVTLIQRFGSALNCFLHWSTVNARLTASGSCWMTRKRVAAGPLIRRVPCSHLR